MLTRLVIAAVMICGCKQKPKAKPVEPEPTMTRAPAPAPIAPSEPPPAAAPPADAGPLDATPDAAPTPSELALAVRAEFFGKVNEASKRTAGDCAQLGTELDALAPQARELASRRAEIEGEHVSQDEAMVRTLMKSVTRIASGCEDNTRVEAFLNIVGAR